jgi:glycerate dehydrogenase
MKIVVLDAHVTNPGDLSWDAISNIAPTHIYKRSTQQELLDRAKDAEIIITNKCLITREVMDALPALRCVCLLATGYNNVDIEYAKTKGITVCNAVGYSTYSVAQHVFALITAIYNKVHIHSQSVHDDRWSSSMDWSYRLAGLNELYGKTLGVYGFGTIGQKVADVGLALGMKVIATKRRTQGFHYANVELVNSQYLLEQSDILSLNASLNDDNKFFINKASLTSMKPNAIIINTARGPLINESDLAEALKDKIIAGAGLDVLSKEPPEKDNPLFGIENCIITPHISWSTIEARSRLINIVAENIKAYISGNTQNTVT